MEKNNKENQVYRIKNKNILNQIPSSASLN